MPAIRVFAGYTVTVEDTRFDYGEERFSTVGLCAGCVVIIAHTEQAEVIRIISMRRATKNEEKSYFATIPQEPED